MFPFLAPIRRAASVPAMAGVLLFACLPCAASVPETTVTDTVSATTAAPPVQAVGRVCEKRSKLGHCEHWRKRIVSGKPKASAAAHR
jgi:hypothetical protein